MSRGKYRHKDFQEKNSKEFTRGQADNEPCLVSVGYDNTNKKPTKNV